MQLERTKVNACKFANPIYVKIKARKPNQTNGENSKIDPCKCKEN
jgi:hypothetical protein